VKIYDEQHNFAGYLVKDRNGYCLSGASDSSVKNVNLFRKRIKTGMPWNKELLYWLAVCEAMAFIGCLVWLMVQTPSPGQTYCFLFVPSGLFFILPPFCMLMRFIITVICGFRRKVFFIPAAFELVEAGVTVGITLIGHPTKFYNNDYDMFLVLISVLLAIVEIVIFWLFYEYIIGKNVSPGGLMGGGAMFFLAILYIFSAKTDGMVSIVNFLMLLPMLYHMICFICYVYLIHKMNFVKAFNNES
jgi:hypothetical protein